MPWFRLPILDALNLSEEINLETIVAESELLTGGAKNESRFQIIDELPWAAENTPYYWGYLEFKL